MAKQVITYTLASPRGNPEIAYNVFLYNGVELGQFLREVDGFFVFYPNLNGGFWEAWVLNGIAAKLDELNKPWEETIERELGGTK